MERRTAKAADAASVVSWFASRAEAIQWGGPAVPDPLTTAWLAGEFDANRYWVWINSEGGVTGVFGLMFPAPGTARVVRVALSPSLRGRGLAKGLMQEIIVLAVALGAKRLTLGVYGSNHVARRVYDGAGFLLTAERAAPEDPSGVSHQMALSL